jgi:hypothetical protein
MTYASPDIGSNYDNPIGNRRRFNSNGRTLTRRGIMMGLCTLGTATRYLFTRTVELRNKDLLVFSFNPLFCGSIILYLCFFGNIQADIPSALLSCTKSAVRLRFDCPWNHELKPWLLQVNDPRSLFVRKPLYNIPITT